MNDAEVQFAERLAADLERVLGIGIAVDGIELSVEPGGARVTATLLLGPQVETVEVAGSDVESLYRPIIERAAELRQRAAFWHSIGPA